jgi:uncharacterized protein (DUF736 family)
MHLVTQKYSWQHINQTVCGLRFFYGVTLDRPEAYTRIAVAKKPRKLPPILEGSEIERTPTSILPTRVGACTASRELAREMPGPLCTREYSCIRPVTAASCAGPHVRHVSPWCRLARDRRSLIDGAIWPQDGCASIVLSQRRRDFVPLGFAHSSRGKKVFRRHPPLRSGPGGCGADRLRPADRHRDRNGRGLGQPGRNDMAVISTFKQISDGEFMGEINTLRLSGVHIVPEPKGTNENAPSHRICCGRIEVGAGWSKRSDAGRDYLSVKLDDPSLNAPIFANLFKDEGGETYSLIWSRPNRRNGD